MEQCSKIWMIYYLTGVYNTCGLVSPKNLFVVKRNFFFFLPNITLQQVTTLFY